MGSPERADLEQDERAMGEALDAGDLDTAGELGRAISATLVQGTDYAAPHDAVFDGVGPISGVGPLWQYLGLVCVRCAQPKPGEWICRRCRRRFCREHSEESCVTTTVTT